MRTMGSDRAIGFDPGLTGPVTRYLIRKKWPCGAIYRPDNAQITLKSRTACQSLSIRKA